MSDIISLTEAAERHIKNIVSEEGGIGFRIAVKETKCLGFSYDLQVVNEENSTDRKITQNGLVIFIDSESVKALSGLKLDLISKGLGQRKLEFLNPNVESQCGCGDSFSLKDPEENNEL